MRRLPHTDPAPSQPDEATLTKAYFDTDPYARALIAGAYSAIMAHLDPTSFPHVAEVGAGSGLIKTVSERVITSDIVDNGLVDVVASGGRLPFGTGSLNGLVLKDSLHHIPDVESFFLEADRVLAPGGRIVVFDPYWGPLAQFVYRFLHREPFRPDASSWSFPSSGPSDSNQALGYLLLRRDRAEFSARFPMFSIGPIELHNGPSFLLAGGLHQRTPIPRRLLSRMFEWENRRGTWMNALRFAFLVVFEKNDRGRVG